MSHYNELGIEQGADQQEIKRAYFRLARQFTPEKNPEAFMRIRQAYEVLSDTEKRAEYDEDLSLHKGLPEDAANAIMEAERLHEKGLTADAIALLTSKIDAARKMNNEPSANALQFTLCMIYIDEGMSGKAVKLAESLANRSPDNPQYLLLASMAYYARGWETKALAYMQRLERHAHISEELALSLIALMGDKSQNQYPGMFGAMAARVEADGEKAPLLCAAALGSCLLADQDFPQYAQDSLPGQVSLFDDEEASQHWDDPMFAAGELVVNTENIPPDKQKAIRDGLEQGILHGMYEVDRYDILPQIDQVIRNVGGELIFQSSIYMRAAAGNAALRAVQSGIPKTLAALPLMQCWAKSEACTEYDRAEYTQEVFVREYDILMDYWWYKPHLQRFSDEFGELYAYSSAFFEDITQWSDNMIYNQLERRTPKVMSRKTVLALEWLGPDDDPKSIKQEPVRVTKIGRNDPCPCGSGKKYKKCCGQ